MRQQRFTFTELKPEQKPESRSKKILRGLAKAVPDLEPFNRMWHLSENGEPHGQFDWQNVKIGLAIGEKKEKKKKRKKENKRKFSVLHSIITLDPGVAKIQVLYNIIVPRCNDRKMCKPVVGSSGVPLIARKMKRMQLSSIWTLLAASEDPRLLGSAASFKAPLLKAVSWMENNSEKLFCSQSDGAHCWTLFSTAAYVKRNKVPQ
ncbi:hypothetical protein CUMW_168550, partial [Citrus unshiu]